jgi:16S rRNA (adenine1518-N6/adenine1519-N6)-dimethyltransferase
MSPATPSYVRDLLARHKIRLKKSLGQHFLVDENILKKIATAAQLSPEDTVLEIGAGIGTLTQEIAPRAGASSPSRSIVDSSRCSKSICAHTKTSPL